MSAALVAAAGAAAALLLLMPARPRPVPGASRAGGTSRVKRTSWLLWGVAAAALCWTLAGSPRLLVPALVAAGVVSAAGRIWSGRRRDGVARLTRARVIELCDALQAELASGQTPALALERAGTEWPMLAPVARTAVAGGDVPGALRELAAEPGAAALRVVAAAWQVSHRTGHGLADTLGRVADDLRATEQTRRIVEGELSSARATARLLAALPVAALLVGSGAGADPWRFLVGHPLGLACLVGGLVCGYAGLAWIEALARDVGGGR
ncbi:type II secretion system F family protein [Nocardioides vastitatis]|uniref:Type II secretion system F family protein n=1 Tax=Nocardioides vastitatis TaxID=2568655 RepID=A0ABW0ZDS3_9ACTN